MRKLLVAGLALAAALITAPASHAAPSGPSNLIASVDRDFRVTLTWTDNSTAENGFVIERCTGYFVCGSYGEVGNVGANVTTFTDGFEVYSGAMNYRVRAYDASGWSAPTASVAVSWITAAVVYPNLVATQLDSSLFTIDGTAFAAAGFAQGALSYEWSFGDGQIRRTSTPVETVRYARDGTFTVSMRPVLANGPGVTNSITVTATGTPAPAPSVTFAGSLTRGVNRIDWYSFPSTATSVEVLRCKGFYCSNLAVIASVPLSANRFEDRAVKPGQTYTYLLRAVPSNLTTSSTQWFTIRTSK